MYRFLRDIVVECVPYKAGDVVPAEEIPPGSLESLLRLRHVEKYTPPASPTPAPAVEVIESPKPAAKKAAKAASVPSE